MTWTLSAFADEAGSTIDEQIIAAATGGLRHIDLRTLDGYNIAELPLDYAETVKKKLDDAGLTVGMLGSPIGKIDVAEDMQSDLDKLSHLGELSRVFGCRNVRVFSYYNKAEWPVDKWADESISRLKRLTDLAGKLGLVLYNENELHLYGDTGERVEHIAEQCRDGQTFRLIFDFDNYNQCGEDVWQVWEALRDRTDAFHLKDSTAPPEPMHVPIGQGNGRARDILAEAKRSGWDGPLSLEPHLAHSAALAAVGHSGHTDQSLKDLGPAECFQVAATAAKDLFADIGAAYE